MMAAFLVIGLSVYSKYSAYLNSQDTATLSYTTPNTSSTSAELLATTKLYSMAPDSAFINANFDASDNLTDRFAKTAFASYMNLQNGGSSETDAQTAVVSDLVSKAQYIDYSQEYTLKDLKTFSSGNKVATHDYGNAFATIVKTNLTLVANNPDKYSDDLNALAAIYDTIGKQLTQIAVPGDIVSAHLQIINDYASLAQNMRDLNDYQKDPLKGLVAMKNAKNTQEAEPAVYSKISSYFKTNGILFTKEEAGFSWWPQ